MQSGRQHISEYQKSTALTMVKKKAKDGKKPSVKKRKKFRKKNKHFQTALKNKTEQSH